MVEGSGAAAPLPTREAEPQHQTVESGLRTQAEVGPIAIAGAAASVPGIVTHSNATTCFGCASQGPSLPGHEGVSVDGLCPSCPCSFAPQHWITAFPVPSATIAHEELPPAAICSG